MQTGPNRHLDADVRGWHHDGQRCCVVTLEEPQITRDEVTDLIVLLMGIEWKLERIMEELEIDNGEEED